MKQLQLFIASLLLSFALPAVARVLNFEFKTIKLAGHSVRVEIADTPDKSSRGLMFRKKLAEGEGMLFVFPSEEPRSFWMKNTFVDLSIGFIDAGLRLVDIQDMKSVKSEMENSESYHSKAPAKYALEVPKGWFAKNKIKVGDHLTGL